MNLYEIQIREVGDRQPLTTYNVLADDMEDAWAIVKRATAKDYSTMRIEICGAREVARNVIFESRKIRRAA